MTFKCLKNILVLFFLCLLTTRTNAQLKKTVQKKEPRAKSSCLYLSGYFENSKHDDTISIFLWNDIISKSKKYFEPHREFSTLVRNGGFSFLVDSVKRFSYLTLTRGKFNGKPLPILNQYRVEPGDSIFVNIVLAEGKDKDMISDTGDTTCTNCYSLSFFGKGMAKYECRYKMDKEKMEFEKKWNKNAENKKNQDNSKSFLDREKYIYDRYQFISAGQLKILKDYQENLSSDVYKLLQADCIGDTKSQFLFSFFTPKRFRGIYSTKIEDARQFYKTKIKELNDGIYENVIVNSSAYRSALLEKLDYENKLLYNADVPDLINKKFAGFLREKLITEYLCNRYSILTNRIELVNKTLSTVKNKNCKKILESFKQQDIGAAVYNFSLPDKDGRIFNLADFRGKVVFLDFFFTGCGNCITYFKNIVSKTEERFKDNPDVVFITISIDGYKQKWIESLNDGQYTSSNAINLYTAGMGSDHPLIKQLNVHGYPHPLIIDRNGRIFNNNLYDLRTSSEVLINSINKTLQAKVKEPLDLTQ